MSFQGRRGATTILAYELKFKLFENIFLDHFRVVILYIETFL